VGSFDRVIAGLIKEMEKFLGTMKTKVVAEASETNGSFWSKKRFLGFEVCWLKDRRGNNGNKIEFVSFLSWLSSVFREQGFWVFPEGFQQQARLFQLSSQPKDNRRNSYFFSAFPESFYCLPSNKSRGHLVTF
jgi:hypothetical protein